MKKAKFILAAVAVLAIGGSAFALNSAKKTKLIWLAPAVNTNATLSAPATILSAYQDGAALTYATTQFNDVVAAPTYTITDL